VRNGETSGDEESADDDTISGIGVWTGLMPVAEEMDAAGETELERRALVAEIDRLFERYRWFVDRIERPRRRIRCTRILNAPRQQPGAWLRALVELSMIGSPRAKVFLEEWEPPEVPDNELEIELFRRICATKCDQ